MPRIGHTEKREMERHILHKSWIRHEELMAGGTLVFDMSDTPSESLDRD